MPLKFLKHTTENMVGYSVQKPAVERTCIRNNWSQLLAVEAKELGFAEAQVKRPGGTEGCGNESHQCDISVINFF